MLRISRVLNYIFYFLQILLFLSLGYRLYLQIIEKYTKNSILSEFLINYQGGFVRRGLLGEIIFQLNQNFNISPYLLILSFSFLCFILLIFIFVKYFFVLKLEFSVLLTTLLLGGPIINKFIVRKDCFLLLCFFIIIKLCSKNYSLLLKLLLVNFIGCFAIFTHESFIFFGLIPLLLINFNPQNKLYNYKIWKNFFYFLPIFFSIILCFIFKGNKEISDRIWDSWKYVNFPYDSVNEELYIGNSIGTLGWDPKISIIIFLSFFKQFSYGIYKPLGLLITLLISFVFLCRCFIKVDSLYNTKFLLSILFIQIPGILCLFILGTDYGRWVFLWLSSSIIIYFYSPNLYLNQCKLISFSVDQTINIGKKLFLNKIDNRILFIFSGVYLTYWGLGYYFISTPIGIILNLFWYLTGRVSY